MAKRKTPTQPSTSDADAQKKSGEPFDVWSKSKKKRIKRLRAKQEREGTVMGNTDDAAAGTSAKRKETKDPKPVVGASARQKEAKDLRLVADACAKNITSQSVSEVRPLNETSSTNHKQVHVGDELALPTPNNKKLSKMQQAFMAQLSGSRFRELNEELYTTESSEAFQRFTSNPELYEQYHDGFRHSVREWPVNPVNIIAKWIVNKYQNENQRMKSNTKATKKNKAKRVVVADFGCGDAELAKQLVSTRISKEKGKESSASSALLFHVHSFDLVASCPLVTACDMANVPIESKSVDIAVFCLSLMGTNLADFIREAHRVLKDDGRMKVAEVRSRFATSGKDELKDFFNVLDQLGFDCVQTDRSNKMFVVLEMSKNGKRPDKTATYTAKPCIYKRR